MKKFISLVLALVMALSLTTVAWGAVTEVTTPEQLAAALTADAEQIDVVLKNDITVPVANLSKYGQTPGSGEYKMGGENTKAINIDLGGYKLTLTTSYMTAIGAKNENATITIKNGSMNGTGNSATTWNINDLMFANCNYVFEKVTFDKEVALVNTGKTTTMKNVTINGTGDYYALWITAEGQAVEIDGLTINSSTGRGIKIDEQYVDASAKVTLDVSKAEFNTAKKSAIMVKSAAGADIAASNCDISGVAEDSTNLVWIDEDAADSANLVTVTGATGIAEGTTGHVAQLNGVKYTTLAEAVAAAADGDTIELLAACAENVTVPVITLDPNGYAYTGKLTAPANYQVLKNTAGTYVVVPAVTRGDKFDLYVADAGMKDALAAGAEDVPALSFTEVAAKPNSDGSGNLAYIAASNGEYFVKTTNPTVADYAVTVAGKTDVLYYVSVVDVADMQYYATAKAFTNFGTKCGQLYRVDTTKEYYVIEKAEAGFALAKDDVSYVVKAGGVNVLVGNEIKTLAAAPVDDNNTVLTIDEILGHNWAVTGVKATTTGKTVPTQVTCLNCGAVVTKFYDAATKVPAGTVATAVPGYEQATNTHDAWFFVEPAAASVGGTVVTPDTDKVESAETFDAGIAMYVGMSVMAAAGSAVVLKKKD